LRAFTLLFGTSNNKSLATAEKTDKVVLKLFDSTILIVEKRKTYSPNQYSASYKLR
jgi:hypothetical protein